MGRSIWKINYKFTYVPYFKYCIINHLPVDKLYTTIFCIFYYGLYLKRGELDLNREEEILLISPNRPVFNIYQVLSAIKVPPPFQIWWVLCLSTGFITFFLWFAERRIFLHPRTNYIRLWIFLFHQGEYFICTSPIILM